MNHSDRITTEVRFAVVIYGGISLAVYMNGIVQELLNMVHSTSPLVPGPNNLNGTTAVYRDIAAYLTEKRNDASDDYRFVVDIISGTSAGGINGVCLAKALVRGLDDLNALQTIWLEEGDVDKLLNDKKSEPGLFPSKSPKTSLFNSQRMYAKLLGAFMDMENAAKKKEKEIRGGGLSEQSHVKTLDLYVTATDLRGLEKPILLSDGKAYERLHKHVFPFMYRSLELYPSRDQNHFDGKHDTILAFASRCTSSFPTAFEAVTIRDVMDFLRRRDSENHAIFSHFLPEWRKTFFSEYEKSNAGLKLEDREFADGGYLDNRPFGHAIKAIHAREAYCPVIRKLLYIDPVPEQPGKIEDPNEISFMRNSMLAFHTLPGYETIRQELEGVTERNKWLEAVGEIMDKIDERNASRLKEIIVKQFIEFWEQSGRLQTTGDQSVSIDRLFSIRGASGALAFDSGVTEDDRKVLEFWKDVSESTPSEKRLRGQKTIQHHLPKYDKRDLDYMVHLLGSGYETYHYTRLDKQTNLLTQIVVRAMDAEKRPDISGAVGKIVSAWREHRFASLITECEKTGKKTENVFFRNFDIDFRIRRLNHLRKTIEEAIKDRSPEKLYFGLIDDCGRKLIEESTSLDITFEKAIRAFRLKLVASIRELYRLRALLLTDSSVNPLAPQAMNLRDDIEVQLTRKNADREGSSIYASFDKLANCFDSKIGPDEIEKKIAKKIDWLMGRMNVIIKKGWCAMERKSGQPLGPPCQGTFALCVDVYGALEELGKLFPDIAGRIWYFYDYGYDLTDSTKLPLLAGGDYGEGKPVGIYRISPADATSLWDESKKNKSKLAGISLSSFGGFFEREWRRNDILWGRLDAAERIITALLPDDNDAAMRTESILRAQQAIIDETTKAWLPELKSARFENERSERQYKRIESIRIPFDRINKPATGTSPVNPLEWKTEFIENYDFNRDFDPEKSLRQAGRSSAILSSMVDRLDGGQGIMGKISGYLKDLNWILLGMLDFSTPKTFLGVVTKYWLQLVMFVSFILMLGGYILNTFTSIHEAGGTITKFGLVLLVLDLFLLFVRRILEKHIHGIKTKNKPNKHECIP